VLSLLFCINGVSGFCPVPRSTIAVEGKGQIRDWPKKAPYHTGDSLIMTAYVFYYNLKI